MFYQIESPPTKRFIDLPLVIPAFVKKKPQIGIPLRPREPEIHQQVEIGESTGRYGIAMRNRRRRILDSNCMDRCAGAGFQNGGAQERCLLVVALDKMNPAIP